MDCVRWLGIGAALVLAACGDDGGSASGGDTGATSAVTESGGTTSTATTPTDDDDDGPPPADTTTTDTTGPNVKLDVGAAADTTGGDESGSPVVCHVVDDMNALGDCDEEAPPDSFEPEVQWTFTGPDDENNAFVIPLVANTNDDNGDGAIDLCDIPDVIVPMCRLYPTLSEGHIYILDGETGALHLRIEEVVDAFATPAIGDIDGDGIIEIVTMRSEVDDEEQVHVIALELDGTLMWESATVFEGWQAAVALADLDADGDVEILAGEVVLDHTGTLLWQSPHTNGSADVPTAADLDGDDDLEVLVGPRAFRHDGSLYYAIDGGNHHPQVANLDGDPEPEVLLSGSAGLSLLQHDGTPIYLWQIPGLDDVWWHPAAIDDVDGNGDPEILVGTDAHFFAFDPNLATVYSHFVHDEGYAGASAFDFLGDGQAEGLFYDLGSALVFDEAGEVLLDIPAAAGTVISYPVVADVDNDGSAEIVLVANGITDIPTVQVIRDVEDRWIQARRIWNQHSYHVTNVREDGTIPQHEPRSWELLNTFRTNAQIEGGALCNPRPAG